MANTDAAFGLRPVRHSGGGTIRLSEYTIASGYNTDLFYGDPVKSTGTGRNIEIGTGGGNILGMFCGCEYTETTGREVFSKRWPASTTVQTGSTVKASVIDDHQVVFEAQCDEDIVEADIGNTADLISGTGDSTTEKSGWEIDSSSVGTGAQIKLLGLSPAIHNDNSNDYGNFAVVQFLIAEHELRGATVAV